MFTAHKEREDNSAIEYTFEWNSNKYKEETPEEESVNRRRMMFLNETVEYVRD